METRGILHQYWITSSKTPGCPKFLRNPLSDFYLHGSIEPQELLFGRIAVPPSELPPRYAVAFRPPGRVRGQAVSAPWVPPARRAPSRRLKRDRSRYHVASDGVFPPIQRLDSLSTPHGRMCEVPLTASGRSEGALGAVELHRDVNSAYHAVGNTLAVGHLRDTDATKRAVRRVPCVNMPDTHVSTGGMVKNYFLSGCDNPCVGLTYVRQDSRSDGREQHGGER